MRILVVSDNHGKWEHFRRVWAKEAPVDLMIHLGDSEFVEEKLMDAVDCPTAMVAGNCDYFSELPKLLTVDVPGHRIFLTHGHLYAVDAGMTNLSYAAEEVGADIVMFGHTHVPLLESYGDQTFLNPGSLELPRQANRLCSYALLTVDPRKRLHFEIRYLQS